MVEKQRLPCEANDTASFFEAMNKLFDVLNSRYKYKKKSVSLCMLAFLHNV